MTSLEDLLPLPLGTVEAATLIVEWLTITTGAIAPGIIIVTIETGLIAPLTIVRGQATFVTAFPGSQRNTTATSEKCGPFLHIKGRAITVFRLLI